MIESNEQRQQKLTNNKQSLSAADAELDYFLTLVATIALRLTPEAKKNDTTNSTSTEEAKP
jgi:hypothetical protein